MNIPFGRRVLALTFDGRPILDPYPNNSHLVLGASGSAKTTSVSMTTIESNISNAERAVIINDVKGGEQSAQSADMCIKYGRKFGVLDDTHTLSSTYPHRRNLNPFGGIVAAYQRNPKELLFAIETACHALIEEPLEGDAKNKWFRDCPREELDLGIRMLLERDAKLAIPGALYALMSDPELWFKTRKIAADEGDAATRSRALQSLDLQENNPDQYYQHIRAALSAIRIYEPGSALHDAGRDADLTHKQVLDEGMIFGLVQDQRHAARMGVHYALHMQSFNNALMASDDGYALFLLDELCNAPLKSCIDRVTIMRSYGGAYIYIAQSKKDIELKYGVKQAAILEENCPVVQYLSFSHPDEAEQVSKAIGEELTVDYNLGVSANRSELSGTFSTGKQRAISADELMNLPANQQIIWTQHGGYVLCLKFYQNQADPYCHDLAPNPMEGNRVLPPDPKVTFDPTLRDRKGEPM